MKTRLVGPFQTNPTEQRRSAAGLQRQPCVGRAMAALLSRQVVTIARQSAGTKDRLDRDGPAFFVMHAWAGLILRIDSIHALRALTIGTFLAVALLLKRFIFAEIFTRIRPPLETAGMIILITSARVAFGLVLKNAGVSTAIQALMEERNVNLIFVSWLVAAVIRIAQGSAAVAMLTTAAMISPMLATTSLPYHPV